jgi:sulfatase modifying factor 1
MAIKNSLSIFVVSVIVALSVFIFYQIEKTRPSVPSSFPTYTDPATGMEFVFVKDGCYSMGNTFDNGGFDERPVHEVCLDDFFVGKYETTQKQWRIVMGNDPSYFWFLGSNRPVEQVSWNDVQEFIRRLNERPGKKYRLPTEAEWEYAARSGGKREKYSGTSDDRELGDFAWFDANSGGRTHPVGRKKPNGLGLYDMTGNVEEWVADWYDEAYYRTSPKKNPLGPKHGQVKGARGGTCFTWPRTERVTQRHIVPPDYSDIFIGFRLAFSAQ